MTLVNNWNLLTNASKSLILDLVGFLDIPVVSQGYVCDKKNAYKKVSVTLKEINKKKNNL